MQFTVVGCGDAFGSAGRLQSTYLVETASRRILIDCGATAQIGLNRLGIDANGIDTILISHLHGDHYAGLVWIVLGAQYLSKRRAPLKIVGPPGIEARYLALAELLFPGMTDERHRKFELTFGEVGADKPFRDGELSVVAFEVRHPSGAPSHALRIETGGKIIGFSGDTEWVDALVDVAAGADLFITECCSVDRAVSFHLNWRTIEAKLPQLTAARVMLSHMNPDMLAFAPGIGDPRIIVAEDGLQLQL